MNLKKSTSILLLVSFAFLALALAGCTYSKEYLIDLKYSELKEKISNEDDFILYIGNKSCTHCIAFEPKFRSVINEYEVTAFKIDTATLTTDEYKEFQGFVGEVSTPRVEFFYKGVESGTANRINGNVSENKVIEKLKANEYIKD